MTWYFSISIRLYIVNAYIILEIFYDLYMYV